MKKLLPIIPAIALLAVPSVQARPEGTAVSSGSGTINWSTLFADSCDFVFVRATEGTAFKDPDYAANMKAGKAAGILMAGYHFAEPAVNTPASEASFFWNYAGGQIKADSKTLMPMVDFEEFSGHVGTTSYTAWFNDWSSDVIADGVSASVVLRPVIYCAAGNGACDLNTNITLGAYIANFNGENPQTGTPWSCCTACNAWDPNTGNDWIYWDTGATGFGGSFDISVYNGTLSQLKSTELVTAK